MDTHDETTRGFVLTDQPSNRLRARTVARLDLTPTDRAAMWTLFSRYYAEVSREAFDRDLDKKDDVILLLDAARDSIAGFTTIEVYDQTIDGKAITAVFSGDTVLDESYWGQTTLKRAFFVYLMKTKLSHPTRRLYWFLISKGYKTYLLLARNVPNHYPRYDRQTPAFEQSVLDRLATTKFEDAYDRSRGVLRFEQCAGRVKDGVAPIEAHLLEREDIRFFVKANPGHRRGDELCCLGAIDARLPSFFIGRQIALAIDRATVVARRLWALATASL